ncbi:MAG: aspartate dehydrogenase [Mogibacterium sp.]|nr:aspartate dehydrogenase [Mogibacterium sp.]
MGLFTRKKKEYPEMPPGDFDPVIRCSICTGEQVICAKDRKTGEMHELMLVRTPSDIEGFCAANDIDVTEVQKEY